MHKNGKTSEVTERKALIGHRMQLAAEQAGYTTTVAMADALGVSNSTVSRWWNGLRLPSHDEMAHYAGVVGKRLWWFYADGSDEEFDLVAESLMEILTLTMQGQGLAEAYARVTGETARFGAKERAALAAGTQPLRDSLTRELGADWPKQPARRRRAVMDKLAAEALGE